MSCVRISKCPIWIFGKGEIGKVVVDFIDTETEDGEETGEQGASSSQVSL